MEPVSTLEGKITNLSTTVEDMQLTQKTMNESLRVTNISTRLDQLEKRQDEVIRLLGLLRNELAGISSGMARRDSLMLGSGLNYLRRDSLVDFGSRRNSALLPDGMLGKTVPVMEVDPWTPPAPVQQSIDKVVERQFLLAPWVREKRLRNQLRLVLKDHLDPGPQRRSTVTKIVHDAHQTFPVWRSQLKEAMFSHWDTVQEMSFKDAAQVIFAQFTKTRLADEQESVELYAEHMIEVGQYLRRKASERAERAGRPVNMNSSVTNSKYWYEVRKKINEVLESQRELVHSKSLSPAENDSDGDDESYFSPASPQDNEGSEAVIERSDLSDSRFENRLSNDSGVDIN